MNDGQPLIETYQADVAAALRRMADHIDRNKDANIFGGLAVIIPPVNGGNPIEMLILDAKGDVGQFFATVASRIQMAVTELDELKRRQQGFGVR
jgi:hypothetical protein